MKKRVLVLFVTSLLYACPPSSKQLMNSHTITYSAMTRGGSENIHVKNGILTLIKNHSHTTVVKLNKKQLNQLYNAFVDVSLDSLRLLKVPSKKFLFDGAKHTFIEIKSPNKTYKSISFDHDNPPKELKTLVQVLQSYIQ